MTTMLKRKLRRRRQLRKKIITITAIPCRHKSLTGFLFTVHKHIHIFAQLNEIFSNLRWKIYCMCASSGVAIIYCRKLQLTFLPPLFLSLASHFIHLLVVNMPAIAFFQYLFSYIIDRFPLPRESEKARVQSGG